MLDLEQRRLRTQAVVSRFQGRPFSWTGRRTCLHLARAQMRAMGHRPPKMPDLRSALSARSALLAAGFDDIEGLLDSLLPRIAPASMLIGDLALMDGDGPFDAIVIAVGGKVFGYAEGYDGLQVIQPVGPQPFRAAWRV
ncbi:DUF6950 family protein [Sphingomonas carotinifaciens]|uniref:DUF6950 family protein n=1 Tax=Sphingomonas carotinifaciens TaxID=1166323 RepID=UPI000DD51824